jgi:predicted membrane channel-forming protein YqfA (hemolysin III family)
MDGFHRGCLVAGVVALMVGVVVYGSLPRHVLRVDEMVRS